jgi:hypothetical protein
LFATSGTSIDTIVMDDPTFNSVAKDDLFLRSGEL